MIAGSAPYFGLRFSAYPSNISQAVNWNELPNNVAKPLLKAADNLSDEDLVLLNSNAERINEMTDEVGQTALLSVISDEGFVEYENLKNEYDRALYVFLRDQDVFRRTEEISQEFPEIDRTFDPLL